MKVLFGAGLVLAIVFALIYFFAGSLSLSLLSVPIDLGGGERTRNTENDIPGRIVVDEEIPETEITRDQ